MMIHTYVAHLCYQAKNQPGLDNKNFYGTTGCRKHNQILTEKEKKGELADYMPPFRRDNPGPKHKRAAQLFQRAQVVNKYGKGFLVFVFLMFNTVFWYLAITEYMIPAENYVV